MLQRKKIKDTRRFFLFLKWNALVPQNIMEFITIFVLFLRNIFIDIIYWRAAGDINIIAGRCVYNWCWVTAAHLKSQFPSIRKWEREKDLESGPDDIYGPMMRDGYIPPVVEIQIYT
jgi:hypothetical protein